MKNLIQPMLNIAVIDDSIFYNKIINHQLVSCLNRLSMEHTKDFALWNFENPESIEQENFKMLDVVILDYYLGNGLLGIDFMIKIKSINPECKVLIMSHHRNLATAMETIREGASDFIHKQDKYAIPKACIFVEEVFYQKFNLR